MENSGLSKRILQMNFMKNPGKKNKDKNKKEINNENWEITLPQIENIVDNTIDKLYNKRKKIINDTILKNSRIRVQKIKKKNNEKAKKNPTPKK